MIIVKLSLKSKRNVLTSFYLHCQLQGSYIFGHVFFWCEQENAKNYLPNFHGTWWEGVLWAKKEPTKFWSISVTGQIYKFSFTFTRVPGYCVPSQKHTDQSAKKTTDSPNFDIWPWQRSALSKCHTNLKICILVLKAKVNFIS